MVSSLTFPALLVVVYASDESGTPMVIERTEDGACGVAFFTMTSLAERCRAAWGNEAVLYLLRSYSDFSALIDGFENCIKATHISINPYASDRREGEWIPLADCSR